MYDTILLRKKSTDRPRCHPSLTFGFSQLTTRTHRNTLLWLAAAEFRGSGFKIGTIFVRFEPKIKSSRKTKRTIIISFVKKCFNFEARVKLSKNQQYILPNISKLTLSIFFKDGLDKLTGGAVKAANTQNYLSRNLFIRLF